MKLEDSFPFEKIRPGQREAIDTILKKFDEGKKIFVLEGPTGAGKSAIAYTVAQHYENSYWVCPQKILQDQLMKDFATAPKQNLKPLVDIKGRNAYKCDYWNIIYNRYNEEDDKLRLIMSMAEKNKNSKWVTESGLNCDEGVCKLRDKKSKCAECFTETQRLCPYWDRVDQAYKSDICLMNFKSFLYQLHHSDNFGNQKRSLMIVDEAHNLESELMDFISIIISEKNLEKFNINLPKYETVSEYKRFFEKIEFRRLVRQQIDHYIKTEDIKSAEYWNDLLSKYELFDKNASDDKWVVNYQKDKKKKSHTKIELKPIFVDEFAESLIFRMADKILMMSATILDPRIIYSSLGIDQETAHAYRMVNRFDKDNRPIHFIPSGPLSYKRKYDTYPILVEDIDKLCNKHAGEKGIIHTHNFEIADLLFEECKSNARFLYQKNWDSKEEMLDHHSSSDDTIIVAPAMHEGLDLKDDLARFQIICKVPYPSFVNNPQLKIRMELSKSYYTWLTALKIIQSYGRVVRGEDDWAITYIMDSNFKMFLKDARPILPKWFIEAIK